VSPRQVRAKPVFSRERGKGLPWREQTMVTLPAHSRTWLQELVRRLGLVLLLLALSTAIVYADRDSYSDSADDEISLIDAFYYTTVTITTTGYGDITPVTEHARLLSALVVTPLRIGFLVLLLGTTIEVLATKGRSAIRDSRWRKKMRDHTVIIGYGTMGKSAASTLMKSDTPPDQIVVIDPSPAAVADANRHGLAAFAGDATDRELLRRAEIARAREVIVTVGRDDTTILATLTVRQLNPWAHIIVAVHKEENTSLVRQSGANAVITSSESVGRIVGISAINPNLGHFIEDLISSGEGLEITQRPVTTDEVGLDPSCIRAERVLGVVRGRRLYQFYDQSVANLRAGDEVVVVRHSGTHDEDAGKEPGSAPDGSGS